MCVLQCATHAHWHKSEDFLRILDGCLIWHVAKWNKETRRVSASPRLKKSIYICIYPGNAAYSYNTFFFYSYTLINKAPPLARTPASIFACSKLASFPTPGWLWWAALSRLRWEKGWSPASSTICSEGTLLDMLNRRYSVLCKHRRWLLKPWHHHCRRHTGAANRLKLLSRRELS